VPELCAVRVRTRQKRFWCRNFFFFKENRDMTHLRAGAEATRMQRALRSGQANAKKKINKKKSNKKGKGTRQILRRHHESSRLG
jgi:hypothetical protein